MSIEDPPVETARERTGWSTPWGKVVLAGTPIAIVALVLDVVSRVGDDSGIRDIAQGVMIAAAVVTLIGAVLGFVRGVPVKGLVVLAAVVMYAIGIWWRDHYAVEQFGSPWRVVFVSAIGVLLALGGVAMWPVRGGSRGASGPVSVPGR